MAANQAVKTLDRLANPAACQHDLGIARGGGSPEGQDAARKIFGEHAVGGSLQSVAATAVGQNRDPVENLDLIDVRRSIELRAWLRRDPGHDLGIGLGAHKLGDDVGVDDNHGSNVGGGLGVTGGWGSSSTPLSGAKRRRIASARLGVGAASSSWTAALTIALSSASMDRPWRAARRRNCSPQDQYCGS
jgi:hypothetical protein